VTVDELPALLGTLPAAWREVLPGWTPQAWGGVVDRIRAVSGQAEIAPADPLRALRLLAPSAVKVVILGQDPYPRPGHADGLAFSADQGKPHSLRRVFAVLAADRPGWSPPARWALDPWAEQGVLLLNPVLTVQVGHAASHLQCGWQALTSELVAALCRRRPAPDFLLWGRPAAAFFDAACPPGASPTVLRTRHPSHDFKQEFMAGGSHFAATADRIDWWALGSLPN
jgi:uracil-DNA glycosylase